MRKILCATASVALCVSSVSPAVAQSYGFSGFDAPRGATVTANLRVPLGHESRVEKTSYGLTLGYGQEMGGQDLDGRTTTRAAKLADLRFTGDFKLQKAELASFNLANLDQDRRLKMMGGEDNSLWLVVGIVAVGVGVCLLADCFGDDNDDDDDDDDDDENDD